MGTPSAVSRHLRLALFEIGWFLLVVSALGLSSVVAYFYTPFELGFEYYQVAAPVFLVLFPLSLRLILAQKNRLSIPVAVGLVTTFAVGFIFMVPVTSTSYSVYVPHCQQTFYLTERDSLGYILFGRGFHTILSSEFCR